jgi:YHS domain-containing protein
MPRQNGPFHEKYNGNNLYFSSPSVQNLNVATIE